MGLAETRKNNFLEEKFPITSLQSYYDALEQFDWFYHFSDDHRVWKKGEAASKKIKYLANQSPEHADLYRRFHKHHFSGEPWGTEKEPKPERPE